MSDVTCKFVALYGQVNLVVTKNSMDKLDIVTHFLKGDAHL
jgi:hypothetical protein